MLLVFLVHLRVPRVRSSGAFDGRQLLRMGCKVGARSRSNSRRAVVRRKLLLGVIAGSPRMLSLSGCRPNMCLMSSSLFSSGGVRVDSAVTTVVADVVHRALVHPRVVNVVDVVGVHVIQRRVVEKMPVVPSSTFITSTEVTEAIVDPTIEAYGRAPIAFIEKKSVAAPTPIARSPEVPGFRSHQPCARHPIVVGAVPSPVSRRPEIAVARADRLRIIGQRRRSYADPHPHGDLRGRRYRQRQEHCECEK